MAEAYIVEAFRPADGRRGGALAGVHPADLAAVIPDALVDKTGIDPAAIAAVQRRRPTPALSRATF